MEKSDEVGKMVLLNDKTFLDLIKRVCLIKDYNASPDVWITYKYEDWIFTVDYDYETDDIYIQII